MAPPPTPPLQPDCQIAPPSLWPMAMSITMYIESYQWLLLLVNWPQNRAFGCLNEGVWGQRSLRKGWMNISHWYASDTAPAGQKPCNHHCHRSTGPVAPCSQSVTKSVIKSDTKKWFSTDAKKKKWHALHQSTCTWHTSLIACKLDPSSVVEPLATSPAVSKALLDATSFFSQ